MSGIAGIVNLDGAPVDAALLRRMTDSLAFRGPDARNMCIDGRAGFGHALLRTTDEAEHEHQPLSFDGQVFIVADARVDARRELVAKLRSKGHEVTAEVPDVELILRAYESWGEDCVDHLLGDFAFAIWDMPRRRLFFARDHLGVRPFYFAYIGQTVVFSNTLDTVRMHPAVSDKLNDLAIGDFLLFGFNQEVATTVYADIYRVPPAHTAVWSPDGFKIRRYWTLPIDEPVFYKRGSDYVERFRELLETAVEERLRTDKLAVFMSGGLDSTTLAATACSVYRKQHRYFEVHAFTSVFDDYSDERRYATMVAEHLKIPIHFRVGGPDDSVDPNWNKKKLHTPEPIGDPLNLEKDQAWFREAASHSRVFFWGEGSDNALSYEWRPYLKFLIGRGQYFRAVRDICAHVLSHRRIPLLPTIPRMIKQWFYPDDRYHSFPPWLNPGFESQCNLRARWEEQFRRQDEIGSAHPTRPAAYGSFVGPIWQAAFELWDSGSTGVPLECRAPFVDLRLLRYMLALPAMPWCRVKYLERKAAVRLLPEAVRRRRKHVFRRDPIWDVIKGSELPALSAAESRRYISDRITNSTGRDRVSFYRDLATRGLDYWLQNRQRVCMN